MHVGRLRNDLYCVECSVVAPSNATEKNRNIGAQLQSILYTTAQKRFWKIYFLYAAGKHRSGTVNSNRVRIKLA